MLILLLKNLLNVFQNRLGDTKGDTFLLLKQRYVPRVGYISPKNNYICIS